MYSEQLKSILLLELSLFLVELILFALLLNVRVLRQQFTVLILTIWSHTLVDQLFDHFENHQRSDDIRSLVSSHGFDLVDKSFDFDRSVVLNIR
jgi:hypothetical protein